MNEVIQRDKIREIIETVLANNNIDYLSKNMEFKLQEPENAEKYIVSATKILNNAVCHSEKNVGHNEFLYYSNPIIYIPINYSKGRFKAKMIIPFSKLNVWICLIEDMKIIHVDTDMGYRKGYKYYMNATLADVKLVNIKDSKFISTAIDTLEVFK